MVRDGRKRVILKTAKQERTINPDTRLHSDEMRKTDERGQLARNPKEKHVIGKLEGSCLGNWSVDERCPVVIRGWKECQYLEEVTNLKERRLLFIHTSLPHQFSVTPPFGYCKVKKMKMKQTTVPVGRRQVKPGALDGIKS